MKTNEMDFSSIKLARITGVFYLLIIICGLYGGMIVRESIVVPLDQSTTLKNLIENEPLFRAGFISDLIMVISDVMVTVLFYLLLKPINKALALFAAIFRLIQSAILGANLINLFIPLLQIQGHSTMDAMQLKELESTVMLQMEVFEYGYLISGVFFSINCIIMGYLLYKSELFPNIIGIMIGIAAFGYIFNCMANFIAPSLVEISQLSLLFTAVIAELSLCLWLLIKGTKKESSLKLT